ncbi:MAG: NINE protein [Muribaculaceae bacterium]|nr:NINE protein [Muribaculaceae bacterium]
MYIHQCPECGKQYSTQEKVNRVKCPYCGAETNVSYSEQERPNYQEQWKQFGDQASAAMDDVFSNGPSGKSRGVAGLLALFLGGLGLHYFYMNKTNAGVVFLLVTLLSCGVLGIVTQIISIIQAVLFFTSTQQEFEQKWVYSPSNIPLF